MCGRYGRRADKQRIAEWMQTHDTNVFDDSYLAPSYNVAPQTMQPIRFAHSVPHRHTL
jgi:putative SOS response-associated peptidase YedK